MSSSDRAPAFERRSADWLGWREARSRVLGGFDPLPEEEVSLPDALGRALARPLTATADLPPWDNSAMDGYAVRGEDVAGASREAPALLRVVGRVRAGERPGTPVGPSEAIRIMTGAPVPRGADSVVRVEHTDREARAGRVAVFEDGDRGRNVRPAGQDMTVGDAVLPAGRPIRPGTVGVLAALGLERVPVRRRPTVGIVPTGEELRPPSRYDDVRAGLGVPETNGPMLAAAARVAGAIPHLLEVAPDDADVLRRRLRNAADHDVVVTIGGASMGEADLVKRVLDELGYVASFWRVRMRPGTPFGFGWIPRGERRVPVFGLPGNPSSAFVTFELFVRPALLRLAGHERILRRSLRCRAGADLPGGRGKAVFVRVALEPGDEAAAAVPTGPQSSGLVRPLSGAEGLALVPEGRDGIPAGEEVEVLLLDDAPGSWPWVGTEAG